VKGERVTVSSLAGLVEGAVWAEVSAEVAIRLEKKARRDERGFTEGGIAGEGERGSEGGELMDTDAEGRGGAREAAVAVIAMAFAARSGRARRGVA
jgi:RimJ/RimL family protein N-acetyltransferase